MKKLLLIIISIALLSCSKRKSDNPVSMRTDNYYITDFHAPKHFYVTLRRETDGTYFNHVYVSKHCNNVHSTVWVGKKLVLTRIKYRNGETETEEFKNGQIYDCLCR